MSTQGHGYLSELELSGLRTDFDGLLGIDPSGDETAAHAACTITRIDMQNPTQRGTIDPSTLLYDTPEAGFPVAVYSGACHVTPIVFRRDRSEIGAQEMVRVRVYRVKLPYLDSGGDVIDVHIDDDITFTASDDAAIVNRPMKVTDVIYHQATPGRLLTVTDISDD